MPGRGGLLQYLLPTVSVGVWVPKKGGMQP